MAVYEHGTHASYTLNGCRCESCRMARRAYDRRRWEWVNGFAEPPRVDAEPARQRLAELTAEGFSVKAIAKGTGLSKSSLDGILGRRADRDQTRMVRRETLERLEAFGVADALRAGYGFVPAAPFMGLIRELIKVMPRYQIARRITGNQEAMSLQLGVSNGRDGRRKYAKKMKNTNARAVVELYEEVIGPVHFNGHKRGSLSDRVLDLLTSHWGEWFSMAQIIAELEERWPDTVGSSVKRAVYRLRDVGDERLKFTTIPTNRGGPDQLLVMGECPY